MGGAATDRRGLGRETLSPYPLCVMTLDLRMPGLGGFDVIEYVRLAPDLNRTKILVVSALENIELDRARLLGADDILQKPFEAEELAARVVRMAGVELRA